MSSHCTTAQLQHKHDALKKDFEERTNHLLDQISGLMERIDKLENEVGRGDWKKT